MNKDPKPTPEHFPKPLVALSSDALASLSRSTVSHYQRNAHDFREGTKDHDVSQNVDALLRHLPGESHQRILDLGCGPGRDLMTFLECGHLPVGLDGAEAFVEMARTASGCEVWHQDFLALALPPERFDGVFANAVLFHVPTQELLRVLGDLHQTLVPGGVLFASNPRGPNIEQQHRLRYGAYLTFDKLKAGSLHVFAPGLEREVGTVAQAMLLLDVRA
ncbi:MAG: class I SAM-dependent methyltransferase, partial [Myxococcota bacterium]